MKKESKNDVQIKYNYSKLLGKIEEIYDTQEKFALARGSGRVSLSQRLNGKLECAQNEILKSCELLKIKKKDIPIYFFVEDSLQ